MTQPIQVVYHTAAMGDPHYWRDTVTDQLQMLKDVGLTTIRITHVGGQEQYVLAEGQRLNLDLTLVRSDPQILHYETFAILEIERLAKESDLPIMYLHTKGVSCPGDLVKWNWRKLMEHYVIRKWKEHLAELESTDYDTIGINWRNEGFSPHYSGNFWIAKASHIRSLPDFPTYHASLLMVRYTCEFWIGSSLACKPKTLLCNNQDMLVQGFDFTQFGDYTPIRLNLGCYTLYRYGWINIDLNLDVVADLYEDAVTLPSFQPGTVSEIFAGHLAEHVPDVGITFARWFELLKPGGRITIIVPDAEAAIDLWRSRLRFPVLGLDSEAGLIAITSGYTSREHVERDPLGLQKHRRVFDASMLRVALQNAGFCDIEQVDDHPIAVARCSEVVWQLAMRASKPQEKE